MYRIFVLSSGKYHNVTIGHRYCFRKKSAIELINLFSKDECNFYVEKLIRLNSDIFAWSDTDDDKVLNYFNEKNFEKVAAALNR